MRRITALTRYDELGASSRVRFHHYGSRLAAAGFELDFHPLLDSDYLVSAMQGRRSGMAGLKACARRALSLPRALQGSDLVWLEKEIWPFAPAWLERLWLGRRRPLVIDYDDAIFHVYDTHPRAVVRKLLGQKIDRLMAAADLVVCGSRYIEVRAIEAGARRTLLVPTMVEPSRYAIADPSGSAGELNDASDAIRIAWIGTPFTYVHLTALGDVLGELATRRNIELHVIGVTEGSPPHPSVPTVFHPWSDTTESSLLADCDIGVMPLERTPFTAGKCAYKIVQYMAAGLPVVATELGANMDTVEEGGSGLLVDTPAEWVDALDRLCATPALRASMGTRGRQLVEQRLCYDVGSRALASAFEQLLLEAGASRGERR